MRREEIPQKFKTAMETGDIYMCYQPQYNHSTGRMIGAEALMRWYDPEEGNQNPGDFIPVLENEGLIHDADLYAFEQICKFLRNSIDQNIPLVPISFNVSRFDIYHHDFVGEIEEIRKKYNIPVRYLRAEITETSAIGGMDLVVKVLDDFHKCGYIVEMDDFGNGYSSLNVLKDLPVDVVKLDMRFLSGNINGRGGIIINSIVQMAKWLNTPMIAEGVETHEQADFMNTVGCRYIQGFLYARPMKEDMFRDLLKEGVGTDAEIWTQARTPEAGRFLDPDSIESLFFNHYVGPAMICVYDHKKASILRANSKFYEELQMNISHDDAMKLQPWQLFGGGNREIYETAIQKAEESKKEIACDTTVEIQSECCGKNTIYLRNFIRVIGKLGEQDIVYVMVRNITDEKTRILDLYDNETKFQYAIEHAGIYAWEFDCTTNVMRPCFRCMRDLGLPALLENYPEPAIERGIIPQDYADMYRDWHRQLKEGAKELEAVIPLTPNRIPFRVKYTTKFDEAGKPYKAYASATPEQSITQNVILSEMALALAKEHLYVLEIDLNTGHYYNFKSQNKIETGDNYLTYIKEMICPKVHPNEQSLLLKKLSRENISNLIENPIIIQMDIPVQVQVVNLDINRICLLIDKDSSHLDDTLKYEGIIKTLAKDFMKFYYVDLHNDHYTEYTSNSGDMTIERTGDDFFKDCMLDAREMIHPDDYETITSFMAKENIQKIIADKQIVKMTYRLRSNNEYIYVGMKISAMNEHHFIVGVTNVDEEMKRKQELAKAEEEKIAYTRIFSLAGNYICIYVIDPDTNEYIEYNASEEYNSLGISKKGSDFFKDALKNSKSTIYPSDLALFQSQSTKENILQEIKENGTFVLEYRLIINGKPKYVSLRATINDEGHEKHLLIGVNDVDTEVRKRMAYNNALQAAEQRANIDALTNVKNKHAYIDAEEELNSQIKTNPSIEFGIAVFDVNGLKRVNDTMGHQAGDRFLQSACSTICNVFKHSPVFRIGGDEFATILRGHDYENVDWLVKDLYQQNEINLVNGMASVSVGISKYRKDDNYVSDVFGRADTLMYEEKKEMKKRLNIQPDDRL